MPSGNQVSLHSRRLHGDSSSSNLQNIPADMGFCAAFKIKLNFDLLQGTARSNPHTCRHWATCALAPSTSACACSAQLPVAAPSHEGLLERLGALAGHTAGFVHEDLLEVAEPAAHVKDEAKLCL